MAHALRRTGLVDIAAAHIRRRMQSRWRATDPSLRRQHGGARAHGLRQPCAAGILSAAHSLGRALVVSGLLGAWIGLGSCLAADARRVAWRSVSGEWPEDLEHVRTLR